MNKHIIALLCVVLALTACDSSNKTQNVEPPVATPPAPYAPPPAGELKNPTFVMGENGEPIDWTLLQHSTSYSYRLSVEDGVLSFARVDHEPWGVLRQTIRTRDIGSFLGKTLEFSADVSGDFTDEHGEMMEPTALTARVRGLRAGDPPMIGRSNLAQERVDIMSEPGHLPWQRFAVRFYVPAADEASAVEVDLNILMTGGGVMRVRGPSLVVVGE